MLEEPWKDGKASNNDAHGELRQSSESHHKDVKADVWSLREFEIINRAEYRGDTSP